MPRGRGRDSRVDAHDGCGVPPSALQPCRAEFDFAEPIVVGEVFKRHHHRIHSSPRRLSRCTWKRAKLVEPRAGIYLGKRTIYNGYSFLDGSGMFVFRRDRTPQGRAVVAILVSLGPRENPVYAYPPSCSRRILQPW